MDCRVNVKPIVDEYLSRGDASNENSNMGFGPNGLLFAVGCEAISRDNLLRIKEAGFGELAELHDKGGVHIHDLGLSHITPYCLTGDTIVRLSDGTRPTIKELTETHGEKSFEVLAYHGEKVISATASSPRMTRANAKVVEVVLDSGKSFRCTPDHKIMVRDGSYVAAGNLKPGQSLMPCYLQDMPNGYVQWHFYDMNTHKTTKKYLHRALVENQLEEDLCGKVVHHKNGNKSDNRLENLEVLDDATHRRFELARTKTSTVWQEANSIALARRNKSDASRERSRVEMRGRWDKAKAGGNLGHYYNHRVKEVRPLPSEENVYCMDVEGVHNFVLDVGVVVHNCAGHSLPNILEDGVTSGSTVSKPAKHFRTAINHIVNFIGCASNEFAGAQALNDIDIYLAPYAFKAYLDNLTLGCPGPVAFAMAKREVCQSIQELLFHLNFNNRWGGQTPFSNITMAITCPPDLKDRLVLLAGKPLAEHYGAIKTGVIVKGDITYGDLGEWQDLVANAVLDTYMAGDGNGNGFSFPVLTVNVTPEFFQHPIRTKIYELTAKFGTPFFQNFVNGISGGQRISPEDVRSMCCRLSINEKEIQKHVGGLFGSADQTGSEQVITVSLPFVAQAAVEKAKAEGKDEFWKGRYFLEGLAHTMDLCKGEMLWKREIIDRYFKNGFYQTAKSNFKRGFDTFFTTIGFIGLWEAVEILTGNEESFLTEKGMELAKNILTFMRERVEGYTADTKKLFNLEATPAESASYKLAKKALKEFPNIKHRGSKKAPYFTNSCHLPVEYQDRLDLVFETQGQLQTIPNGGTATHFYTGEELDPTDIETFVKSVCETNIPYFSITTIYSVCVKHGRIAGAHEFCPKCTEEDALEIAKTRPDLVEVTE